MTVTERKMDDVSERKNSDTDYSLRKRLAQRSFRQDIEVLWPKYREPLVPVQQIGLFLIWWPTFSGGHHIIIRWPPDTK